MAYLGMKFLRHKFFLSSLRTFFSTKFGIQCCSQTSQAGSFFIFWLFLVVYYLFCLAAYGRLYFFSQEFYNVVSIYQSLIFSWHMVAIFIVQIQILFYYRKSFLLLYHLLLVLAFLFCPLFHECQLFLFICFYSSHFHLFIFLCV